MTQSFSGLPQPFLARTLWEEVGKSGAWSCQQGFPGGSGASLASAPTSDTPKTEEAGEVIQHTLSKSQPKSPLSRTTVNI